MFERIFEILFIISSLGILFNICNNQQIFYIPIIITITFVLLICLLLKKNTFDQYGGKKTKIRKTKIRKITKNNLLNECGLPNTINTGHCFSDSTHHTCCMLGPKARAYADKTGNPIGKASIKAYQNKTGKKKVQNKTLTPWCTCTGSEVCSYYADKFNDGTHIKFINNPNTNEVAYNPKSINERKYKNKFNIYSHRTPGIN